MYKIAITALMLTSINTSASALDDDLQLDHERMVMLYNKDPAAAIVITEAYSDLISQCDSWAHGDRSAAHYCKALGKRKYDAAAYSELLGIR